MGGYDAARVLVEGPGERRRVVLASRGAVEKDDNVNDEVSLETTKAEFDRDSRIFDSIVESFKYLSRSPRVGKGKIRVGGALLVAPAIANDKISPLKKDTAPPE